MMNTPEDKKILENMLFKFLDEYNLKTAFIFNFLTIKKPVASITDTTLWADYIEIYDAKDWIICAFSFEKAMFPGDLNTVPYAIASKQILENIRHNFWININEKWEKLLNDSLRENAKKMSLEKNCSMAIQ